MFFLRDREIVPNSISIIFLNTVNYFFSRGGLHCVGTLGHFSCERKKMEATRKTNNFGARGEKEEDQGRYPRWEVGPASIANRAGCCSARGATRARTCGAYPSLPPHTHMCACMRTTTLYACVATAPAATATAPARVSYHATPCMPTAAAPPLETWSLGGGGSHMSVRLSSKKKNQL